MLTREGEHLGEGVQARHALYGQLQGLDRARGPQPLDPRVRNALIPILQRTLIISSSIISHATQF